MTRDGRGGRVSPVGGRAPRVVLAVDKFKGCLTGRQVADALAEGIGTVRPDAEIVLHPVSDGGEGLVGELARHGFRLHWFDTWTALRAPVRVPVAVKDGLVVVEAATACGLSQIPEAQRRPLDGDTYGVGVLIDRCRRELGAHKIVIGAGGSATTDGGAGALVGLGSTISDDRGRMLATYGPSTLANAEHLQLPAAGAWRDTEVVLATDVTNPLLGPLGAASVFGPQKGATLGDIAAMDHALAVWARIAEDAAGRRARDLPGSGAAGGLAFGLRLGLGAEVRDGLTEFAELTGLERAISLADHVITGEGSLDKQTTRGKAPIGVLALARKLSRPCWAVAGRIQISRSRLRQLGFASQFAIRDIAPDDAASLARAEEFLRVIGARWASEVLREPGRTSNGQDGPVTSVSAS